jgi:RNA-binding motif X-linked protein 2
MQSVRQIARLNDLELQKCAPPNASWHTDYRDTAYIHIGGLPFELSEGDVLTIFSQYGNPVHLHLARDKETGKSRGFAFLKYEDQRSCDLAVDNLSGAGVLGRVLGVDHCRYQLKDGEVEGIPTEEDAGEDAGDETDREGDARRKKRRRSRSDSESEEDERRPLLKEEAQLAKLLREHDEDDPMKSFLVQEKKDEVAEALKRLEVSTKDGKGKDRGDEKKRRHHRSRKHGSDDEDEGKRRERHRSSRHGEKDDTRNERHRSRQDADGDGKSDKHHSRRDVDGRDRPSGRQRSERYPSPEDEPKRRRDERKHKRSHSPEENTEHRRTHDRSKDDRPRRA